MTNLVYTHSPLVVESVQIMIEVKRINNEKQPNTGRYSSILEGIPVYGQSIALNFLLNINRESF